MDFKQNDLLIILESNGSDFIGKAVKAVSPFMSSVNKKVVSPDPKILELEAIKDFTVKVDSKDFIRDSKGRDFLKINGPRPLAVKKR